MAPLTFSTPLPLDNICEAMFHQDDTEGEMIDADNYEARQLAMLVLVRQMISDLYCTQDSEKDQAALDKLVAKVTQGISGVQYPEANPVQAIRTKERAVSIVKEIVSSIKV
jgi:hypothetical protein